MENQMVVTILVEHGGGTSGGSGSGYNCSMAGGNQQGGNAFGYGGNGNGYSSGSEAGEGKGGGRRWIFWRICTVWCQELWRPVEVLDTLEELQVVEPQMVNAQDMVMQE